MKKIKLIKWLTVLLILLIYLVASINKMPKDTGVSDQYPSKPITVIVAYGAGGVTDLGARILMPYLEKELGVPLHVVNINGEAGWAGWNQLLKAPADGYTISYINTPSLITGYMNPQVKRNRSINDFTLIANQVIDYGAIAIRPNERRFTNIRELIGYARTHDVTSTSTGLASDDHLTVLKLNSVLGTRFIPAHAANSGRLLNAVIGGHIDVFFGNVGEVTLPHKRNELTVIASLSPERSEYLPDVPTLEEIMGVRLYSWAARGVAGPTGLPQEKREVLTAAFLRAMRNEEFQKKMAKTGLALRPLDGEEFRSLLEEDEQGVRSVIHLLNWK